MKPKYVHVNTISGKMETHDVFINNTARHKINFVKYVRACFAIKALVEQA